MASGVGTTGSPDLTVDGGDWGKRVRCADLGRIFEKVVLGGWVDGGGVISALLEECVGKGGGVDGITMSGRVGVSWDSGFVAAMAENVCRLLMVLNVCLMTA
jgi:hypothetical protein